MKKWYRMKIALASILLLWGQGAQAAVVDAKEESQNAVMEIGQERQSVVAEAGGESSQEIQKAVAGPATGTQDTQAQSQETETDTEQKSQDEQGPQEVLEEGPFLEIDNSQAYTGMEKSFQEGYVPKVKKNQVLLVVPFKENGVIKDGKLQAEVDLGDASAAPFVFKNYNTTLQKESYDFEGDTSEAYLLTLKLDLKEERESGSFPVKITLKGRSEGGIAISEEFTFYVTLTPGKASVKDKDAKGDAPVEQPASDNMENTGGGGSTEETKAKPQPKVILQELKPGSVPLMAGEQTEIKAIFLNTNRNSSIQNITVSVGAEGNTMLFDKKSFYFGQVSPGQTFEVSFQATVLKETTVSTDKLVFAIDYNDEMAAAITESEDFTVQISQPISLSMENLDIPATVYAAETIPVSMKVINMSRVKVYNVRYVLEAEGLIPKESAFIGNMEAGSAAVGTVSVYVGTKDLAVHDGEFTTDETKEKYGLTEGVVTVSYEDEFGESYTMKQEFTTTIDKPEILSPVIPKQDAETAGEWWISILAALGGGILVFGIFAVRRMIMRKADTYDR